MKIDDHGITLVIATYNWPAALDLVLKSVKGQSVVPSEVVIADDGSTDDTRQVIKEHQKNFDIPIRHFWHEDNGFMKTIILNEAMKTIENPYIIQIDGDVILHPMFIEDHMAWRKKGCWIKGSRVFLGKEISKSIQKSGRINFTPFTKDIKNRLNAIRSPLLRQLFFDRDVPRADARGCNMSYWTEDFFKVNGFNEEITGYGREDSELSARFTNNGILRRSLKFGGIQYHIDHKFVSRDRNEINIDIENETLKSGVKFCKKGIVHHP